VLFLLIVLALVAIVVGIVYYTFRSRGGDPTEAPVLATLKRDSYDHIVLEEGEVESSNNVEIRCEVRSRSSGSAPSTSIIDVIEEGKQVKEGDWLITFDSAPLEQEVSRQRIIVNTSEAIVIQAKADYDTALIAKEEYLEGAYNEQKKTIENEIFVAEESLKKAQLSHDSIKRLVSRGLLDELQLAGEDFKVKAAQNELDLAKQKLSVLEQFTKRKMLTQLESDIQSAEVKWRNEQDSHQEELNNLKEIQEQIVKCKVTAPQAGQVVYANVQSSRSGSEFVVEAGVAVRERQVIIRLPDPSAMQVKAKISESRINLIREGMPVAIRIDAFGDGTLQGEVKKVNKYAEAGNWWMSSGKEYATLISILNPGRELRVGLTAEVQIHVEHRDDALLMPVQVVYERVGKTFCLVQNGEKWDTRELVISSTNDKMVAVDEEKSDLFKVGDQLVLNPRQHVDKFDHSRFPKEGAVSADTAKRAPSRQPAAGNEQTAKAEEGAKGGPGKGAGGGGPGGGGRRGGSPADMIKRMDTDGDGKLSSDELSALPGGFGDRLKAADTNSDGFVDTAELTAAFAKMRAAGGGGGQGGPGGGGGRAPGGDS
jgi:multidrug resistance efflux pump